MKICPKCGTELSDESKFCTNCGTPVPPASASVPVMPSQGAPKAPASVPVMPAGNASGPAPVPLMASAAGEKTGSVPKKKRSPGKILIAAVLFLLLGALILLVLRFLGSSAKAVELNECVEVAFAGYEGDGQVSYYVNPNTLKKQVEKALGESVESSEVDRMIRMIDLDVTLKSKAETESGGDGEDPLEFSETDISHLSRGDVINVRIIYDDLQRSYPDIEFKGKSFDVEVRDGLKSYASLDPFRFVELGFSGASPFGKIDRDACGVSGDCPDEYLPYYQVSYYRLDKMSDLAVGDVIHMTYTQDGQRAMRADGYKASRTEADYTVQNTDMARYIRGLSELDQTGVDRIRAEADDRIRARCADKYKDPDAAVFLSAHLMIPKEGNWGSRTLPYLVLFYRAQYTTGEGGSSETSEAYLAVRSSALWFEKPEDGIPEEISFSIPDFSGAEIYAAMQDMENKELIQKELYQRFEWK